METDLSILWKLTDAIVITNFRETIVPLEIVSDLLSNIHNDSDKIIIDGDD